MRIVTSACAATLLVLFSAAAPASAQLSAPTSPGTPPATAATPSDPATAQKEADARLAAQGWLVLLDRRDWGRAWETTSSAFRSLVPLGAWMDGIPKVRDPFGAMAERKIVESFYKTSLEGQPPGEYVSIVFESKFANRPSVVEALTTVLDKDGKWRVTGYSAQ